jgi:hypothetical protein
MHMCARTSFIAFAVGAIVLSVSPRGADAQHMTPPAVPVMPQAHVLAEMYAKAFEQNIATGRGFGMAFVADQNGYPGPLHVLELKDPLQLTTEQESKIQALLTAMFAESKPKSASLLDA